MAAGKSVHVLLSGMLAEQNFPADINVTNITLDSREVQTGSLFISLAKESGQRLQYLEQAIKNGAVVIAYDSEQLLLNEEKEICNQYKVKTYPIENLSANTGEIAARFYGHPSEQLTVIAVTGTNGKTSVSQFIAQAYESLDIPCGVIGTLGVGRVTHLQMTGMTTPDPVTMQSILADFKAQGVEYVVIEASSHALEQGRLNSVEIDVAVLTNLSRDHLDYHQTMECYAAAKQRLFEFASIKHAVINLDDDFGKALVERLDQSSLQLRTYSCDTFPVAKSEMHIRAVAINTKIEGISFKLQSKFDDVTVGSSLLGRFNIENLLAATQALLATGTDFLDAIEAIAHCHAIEGRMKVYGGDKQAHVVIDFAHTPDAIAQALSSLKTHLDEQGELWCVFGCGGERDKGKRALMGASAETYADKLVITSDNPRSESNENIVAEILTGIEQTDAVYVEHDREKAINYAIKSASLKDIVLVAGKGHEQYQEILGVKQPFSDVQAVTKALMAANDEHDFNIKVEQ